MTLGRCIRGAGLAAVAVALAGCGGPVPAAAYQCRFDGELAFRETVDTAVDCQPGDDGTLGCAGPDGWRIVLEGEVTEWFSVARGDERWSFQSAVQEEGGAGVLAKVARTPAVAPDTRGEAPAIAPSPLITWATDGGGVVVATFTVAYAPVAGGAPAPVDQVVRVALRLEAGEAPCLTEVFTASEMTCRSPEGLVGVWSSDIAYALDRAWFAPACSAADFSFEELLERLDRQ